MLKKLTVLLAMILLLSMAACGAEDGPAEGTTTEPGGAVTTTQDPSFSSTDETTTADPDHGADVPLSYPTVEWNEDLLAYFRQLIASAETSEHIQMLPVAEDIGEVRPAFAWVCSGVLHEVNSVELWNAFLAQTQLSQTRSCPESFDYTDGLVFIEDGDMIYTLIYMEESQVDQKLTEVTGVYLQDGVLHLCLAVDQSPYIFFGSLNDLTVVAFPKDMLHGELRDLEIHYEVTMQEGSLGGSA